MVTRSRSDTWAWSTQSSPTRAPGPMVTWGWITVRAPIDAPAPIDTNGPIDTCVAEHGVGGDRRPGVHARRRPVVGREDADRARERQVRIARPQHRARRRGAVVAQDDGRRPGGGQRPSDIWRWRRRSRRRGRLRGCRPRPKSPRRHRLRGGSRAGRPDREASREAIVTSGAHRRSRIRSTNRGSRSRPSCDATSWIRAARAPGGRSVAPRRRVRIGHARPTHRARSQPVAARRASTASGPPRGTRSSRPGRSARAPAPGRRRSTSSTTSTTSQTAVAVVVLLQRPRARWAGSRRS